MSHLALHIRNTVVEAVGGPQSDTLQRGLSRVPIAKARVGRKDTFGPTATEMFLDGTTDTIEWSLLGPKMPQDTEPAFLAVYFAALAPQASSAKKVVVCLPEAWRTAPTVDPAWIKREIERTLNNTDPIIVGSGQAAGAYVIKRARSARRKIGSKFLLLMITESDCELSLFAVEQPGDRLRPMRTHTFPGITAFDQSIGAELASRHGGNSLRRALRFGQDRTNRREALNLEWDLIADLPGTEVMTSSGAQLLVEDFDAHIRQVWPQLSNQIADWIAEAREGDSSGALMWASVGQIESLPGLKDIVDRATTTRDIRRIDQMLSSQEREFAVAYGATALAYGEVDPLYYADPAAVVFQHWSPTQGTITPYPVPFGPAQVGGYIASPLLRDPNFDWQAITLRADSQMCIDIRGKTYNVPLGVPEGNYSVFFRVGLEGQTVLELCDSTDSARIFTVPIQK